jgi:membrane protease YdiL (CAAX protease family)
VPAAAIRSDGFQGIKKFLSAAGTILFGILWLVGIALLFVGGAWVGAYVEPWIAFIAVTLIVIGLPICLLLLIFRQSRGWGGTGIFFLSLPLSLWLWVASLVYVCDERVNGLDGHRSPNGWFGGHSSCADYDFIAARLAEFRRG